jgi:hypothetical protein
MKIMNIYITVMAALTFSMLAALLVKLAVR